MQFRDQNMQKGLHSLRQVQDQRSKVNQQQNVFMLKWKAC